MKVENEEKILTEKTRILSAEAERVISRYLNRRLLAALSFFSLLGALSFYSYFSNLEERITKQVLTEIKDLTDQFRKETFISAATAQLRLKALDSDINTMITTSNELQRMLGTLETITKSHGEVVERISAELLKREDFTNAIAAQVAKFPKIGGMFQIDDNPNHINDVPNALTKTTDCPSGYTRFTVGRVWAPESKWGATQYLCL